MTKESERAADILVDVVLKILDLATPGERDLVVERVFASVRQKRRTRLSTVEKPLKREEDE